MSFVWLRRAGEEGSGSPRRWFAAWRRNAVPKEGERRYSMRIFDSEDRGISVPKRTGKKTEYL